MKYSQFTEPFSTTHSLTHSPTYSPFQSPTQTHPQCTTTPDLIAIFIPGMIHQYCTLLYCVSKYACYDIDIDDVL